ncbi:MAG: hypothetical protein WBA73_09060 [Devosia sp.]|jgi:hypothetical protein
MPPTIGSQPGNYLRIGAWSVAAALLLLPLAAMQFTSDVKWGAEDFLAAALLLGGAGLALEVMVRLVQDARARLAIGLAIAAAFGLIWVELAVGIF